MPKDTAIVLETASKERKLITPGQLLKFKDTGGCLILRGAQGMLVRTKNLFGITMSIIS